ncbi:unnamed protein product [Hermetia illucens]|uniref:Uncharacterized protein n=1 Tax=Hermetia illucens TaxID=343691 RepID=A0A7R8YP07_HERIL|nr:unnamed protein product [Hermetia illucens]
MVEAPILARKTLLKVWSMTRRYINSSVEKQFLNGISGKTLISLCPMGISGREFCVFLSNSSRVFVGGRLRPSDR